MDNMNYIEFLNKKILTPENAGIETANIEYNSNLFEHQKDIIDFCLKGGRRAIFASFGLGKTFMQLEIATKLIQYEQKPFLIACPLGVSGEFKRDNRKLGTDMDITYISDTDSFDKLNTQIYLTNYERIRKGDINPDFFCGVSMDEASIIRNLETETTNYILSYFKTLKYRFVATATPTPNDFIEVLNYADFLGVIERGHALTRFFQRDSQKAGNLKLYENKESEFWLWVSSWAAFLNNPADLGYDGSKYVLPKLNIIEHRIQYESGTTPVDKFGKPILFKDITKSLIDASREKKESVPYRIQKALEITDTIKNNCIIWHSLEYERACLEKAYKEHNTVSVYGSQTPAEKEQKLIDFSENKYDYLLTKSKIAGSGCNFQNCHNMIFLGIDYKFNDFIQSVHRCYRYGQDKDVNVHIIYTANEDSIMKSLYMKWEKHKRLQSKMIEILHKYGLNNNLIKAEMERFMFKESKKLVIGKVTMYNNDSVIVLSDSNEVKDNSCGMILTSIPFGDHFEYTENYNDFGHNHGNELFFHQMDFLTPNLLRVLEPGRIAAIHVKDRIRYSYQNGTSFTTISDFSGETVRHFEKHGFYLIGKITVTTDVVAENNQTYRLGWTEQTKDGSKMGVGLPEYILLFRKAPTLANNSYADNPVSKDKSAYSKARWQIDAHSYYRSNGNRLLSSEELKSHSLKSLVYMWREKILKSIYDYREHVELCEALDKFDKLSSTYTTLPVHSNNDLVWTDVNRMRTLNANQVSEKRQKHICPLQLDIIERLITRYTNEGETVLDPFAGLYSTSYIATELNRNSIGIELNTMSFRDGLYYIKSINEKVSAPTLFDTIIQSVSA